LSTLATSVFLYLIFYYYHHENFRNYPKEIPILFALAGGILLMGLCINLVPILITISPFYKSIVVENSGITEEQKRTAFNQTSINFYIHALIYSVSLICFLFLIEFFVKISFWRYVIGLYLFALTCNIILTFFVFRRKSKHKNV
jgi:hypothetical protein